MSDPLGFLGNIALFVHDRISHLDEGGIYGHMFEALTSG